MLEDPEPPSAGRLKRQVSSRVHSFASICPPGFEQECLDEARSLGLAVADTIVAGPVIEWSGKLADLYRANLFSRIASRILVRLTEFHAGAREELFRKTYNFPWELWLAPRISLKVEAHLEHARISHEGMAAETVSEAIARRMQAAGLSTQPVSGGLIVQRIIVHIEDNRARISLDSSGEHLHRRGWRKQHGAAPLRENLAAGLLRWAGWPATYTHLVDGMSASGTFAIEARAMVLGRPAASTEREFAFEKWPSFAQETYNWLGRQKLDGPLSQNVRIIGNDIDAQIAQIAQSNEAGYFIEPTIDWRVGDFFQFDVPQLGAGQRGLLCLNPPYGIRLSDGDGALYTRIFSQIKVKWPLWTVLLLGPEHALDRAKPAIHATKKQFRHGGLRIEAWLI